MSEEEIIVPADSLKAFCRQVFETTDVSPGDAEAMAEAIIILLTDEALRRRLGYDAGQDAQIRFGLSRQVDAYLEWYRAIVERHKMELPSI